MGNVPSLLRIRYGPAPPGQPFSCPRVSPRVTSLRTISLNHCRRQRLRSSAERTRADSSERSARSRAGNRKTADAEGQLVILLCSEHLAPTQPFCRRAKLVIRAARLPAASWYRSEERRERDG